LDLSEPFNNHHIQSETLLDVTHSLHNPKKINNLIFNMPSISTIITGLFALAPLVAAAPAQIDVRSVMSMSASATASASGSTATAAAAAPAGKLTDVDILNL
jgi:prephenate dehydratase